VITELEGKANHPGLGFFARSALRALDELRIVNGRLDQPVPVGTEFVKAFVGLKDGFAGTQELTSEIRDWVKHRLSMHEYPREIEFLDALPMTTTGKIIRRELRARG